jgi:phage regulator Rha-like protein
VELVERRIYIIRSQKVMLSPDLAELYQVETRALVQAVKRNIDRFPEDFMFQLSDEEYTNLKSQIVISSWGGARRATPYAFTEHGVAMLSAVLNSDRAVQMSILIVRAFVRMRELLASHKDLAQKIEKLEAGQKHQGSVIALVADEVSNLAKHINKEFKKLRDPRRSKRRRIGFYDRSEDEKP